MAVYTHGATEKLTLATGASANYSVISTTRSQLVAVSANVSFHAAVGDSADADANDAYYPANVIHYFSIPPNTELSLRGTGDGFATVSVASVISN